MSETIAITGKSVKLFKGHYTSGGRRWTHRTNSVTTRPVLTEGRGGEVTLGSIAGRSSTIDVAPVERTFRSSPDYG
ncbi:MAG: hypothetical protein ACREYE_13145 [Gammaproteobacteria bacterium]